MANRELASDKTWVIRDVSKETKRFIKAYAALNEMTVAKALDLIVTVATTEPGGRLETQRMAQTRAAIIKLAQDFLFE